MHARVCVSVCVCACTQVCVCVCVLGGCGFHNAGQRESKQRKGPCLHACSPPLEHHQHHQLPSAHQPSAFVRQKPPFPSTTLAGGDAGPEGHGREAEDPPAQLALRRAVPAAAVSDLAGAGGWWAQQDGVLVGVAGGREGVGAPPLAPLLPQLMPLPSLPLPCNVPHPCCPHP